MELRDAVRAPETDPGLVPAVRTVIVVRLGLLALVAAMAALFRGAGPAWERLVPIGFLLAVSGVLALAYLRALGAGSDPRGNLATQFLVDVASAAYLLFFTGGTGSQFAPLLLLPPLLGGVFLSVRGGVSLAALSSGLYAALWAAERGGLLPSGGYGLGERLSDTALLLRVILYVPLLFVVGVIGGHLGRSLREGRRALDQARAELHQALFDTESILENMSSGLVTIDADGVVR